MKLSDFFRPKPEPPDPAKMPKPDLPSLFTIVANIQVGDLHIPASSSDALQGYAGRDAAAWDELSEPKMHAGFDNADLKLVPFPRGARTGCVLSVFDRVLDRYAYRGVGLRLALAVAEWYLRHAWSGQPVLIPALGCTSGTPAYPTTPMLVLSESSGTIVREVRLASKYLLVRDGNWFLPAAHRTYFA